MVEKETAASCPREPTPAPGRSPTTGFTGHLPEDLVNDQLGRLALFSLIGIVLWTVGLLIDQLVIVTRPDRLPDSQAGRPASSRWSASSSRALMFVYVRYARTHTRDQDGCQPHLHAPQRRRDRRVEYMGRAAALAGRRSSACRGSRSCCSCIRWWPPVSPGKMLAAALVAASFDPLGVWLAHLRGVPVPSLLETLRDLLAQLRVLPALATIPSRFLRHVGQQAAQSAGAGQLRAGQPARARRHGRGVGSASIACSRAERPSSSSALSCSAPAATPRPRLVLKRFEREAQATAALSSPHTIQLFDFGSTDDGTFYYVMELLTGRDLESLVREFGPLPADAGRLSCCGRSATRWPTRMRAGWCTATSSPPISTCAGWVSSTTS